MIRFSLTTLGCKVNQYDGAALAQTLARAGLVRTAGDADANLVVINTCCVTATAMAKSRQAIRRAVRNATRAETTPAVLVVGCYSDYDAKRLARLLDELGTSDEKQCILGNHSDLSSQIARFVCQLNRSANSEAKETVSKDINNTYEISPQTIKQRRASAAKREGAGEYFEPIERFGGHQRAFVKVQDGCDAFCTYCIVPFTRPRVSWRPADLVADECRSLIENGHKEIVLCGVFLGAYGKRTAIRRRAGGPSLLPDLLGRIAALDGLWRVRLSSLEPADLSDQLLAVCVDSPAVAPHFHLPLQSGSDVVLKRMNRQYAADDFRRTADRLRSTLDRPALTTDIIVGFPGETDDDFAATMDLARAAGFAKIHAFPFSAIEGTAAWDFRDQCPPPPVVKGRMVQLAELEAQLADDYRQQFLGQTMEGLIESPRSGAADRQAMTDRYLTVFFAPPTDANPGALTGQVARFHIDAVTPDGLTGSAVL